jgi:hypothetical protein
MNTSTQRPTSLVLYVDLSQGDMILVEGQEWEFLAAHYPGDGTMALWTLDHEGNHQTLYRRVEESVECPTYGAA